MQTTVVGLSVNMGKAQLGVFLRGSIPEVQIIRYLIRDPLSHDQLALYVMHEERRYRV